MGRTYTRTRIIGRVCVMCVHTRYHTNGTPYTITNGSISLTCMFCVYSFTYLFLQLPPSPPHAYKS